MSVGRIVAITSVLAKSQLRAGRSGRLGERFFRNPLALLEINAGAFALCAILGELVVIAVGFSPESFRSVVVTSFGQALIFVPALVPGVVVVAGMLFELSVSSRFASSDSVNWLPVSHSEYVTASALSISYNYSTVLAVLLGVTSTVAFQFGLSTLWTSVFFFSLVSIFLGGVLVEILRAAVNRVGSLVFRRARRGALLLRLVITILVILFFQLVFNIVFLLEIVNAFSGVLAITPFVPLFWGSIAVKSLFDFNVVGFAIFGTASILFVLVMLLVAIRVRGRYWSPPAFSFSVTVKSYDPRARGLERLGLSSIEAALIRKDLKGLSRRREMLQYLAIPVVITTVLLLQVLATRSSGVNSQALIETMPIWFVGGFFALMISAISFGQEGKAVLNLYSLPISATEVFRAKMFTSLGLSLTSTVLMSVIIPILTGLSMQVLLLSLLLAVIITLEQTFIGLGFASRFADFQERPRPRFLEPVGILLAALTGLGTIFATAVPIIIRDVLTSLPVQSGISFMQVFIASVIFGCAITILAFLWARRGVTDLFRELPY
ncbi:MAG: hypothetical protein HYU03_08310 [Thaumarchaeota archaeon]|nr:hypothetical protein [Nitrososphaerota archaeon]